MLESPKYPFVVDEAKLHVNASIGISLYPDDGGDVDSLMRTADTARYHAKEKGCSNFQFFTRHLNYGKPVPAAAFAELYAPK